MHNVLTSLLLMVAWIITRLGAWAKHYMMKRTGEVQWIQHDWQQKKKWCGIWNLQKLNGLYMQVVS